MEVPGGQVVKTILSFKWVAMPGHVVGGILIFVPSRLCMSS